MRAVLFDNLVVFGWDSSDRPLKGSPLLPFRPGSDPEAGSPGTSSGEEATMDWMTSAAFSVMASTRLAPFRCWRAHLTLSRGCPVSVDHKRGGAKARAFRIPGMAGLLITRPPAHRWLLKQSLS
jgi:hypothetical protein